MIESVTAVLLDDEEQDRRLADLLITDGLQVAALEPRASSSETLGELLSQIADRDFPIVLLDYRLDMSADAKYRGGTVAASLRDFHPDVPIVLFTTDCNSG